MLLFSQGLLRESTLIFEKHDKVVRKKYIELTDKLMKIQFNQLD